MRKDEFLQEVLRLSGKYFITHSIIDNLGYIYSLNFEGRPASVIDLDKNKLFNKHYLFNGRIGYCVVLSDK